MFLFPVFQSTPVWASDDEHPVTDMATIEVPVDASGLRVYRDPVSGRLGPPPAGFRPPGLSIAEQQMLNRSDQGLRERTLPNGAVVVDLQGRFRSMTIATTGTESKPAVNCTHSSLEAHTILQHATPTQQD